MHFHQAVVNNNLEQITVAYESGWNKLTEKYYAKTEWPEAEVIAPLVNDGKLLRVLFLLYILIAQYRPDISHPLSRAILSSRLLALTTRHR